MEKLITINDKQYRLMTNGYTPIAYKNQFGRDYFQDLLVMFQGDDLLKMLAIAQNGQEVDASQLDMTILKNFDMTFFNRLLWTFVKSGDPNTLPFEDFFMAMESFPVQEVAPVLMELLEGNMMTKKHSMIANLQAMNVLQ